MKQFQSETISWQLNFVPANHHICLCELNPECMPLNNWGHGCAVITIDEGQASVQNIRIQNGQVI